MKVVVAYLNRPKQDKRQGIVHSQLERIKEWQDVNNKGKATKRRKATNEVGASFCVLAETQGNDNEEEEEHNFHSLLALLGGYSCPAFLGLS
jgi:hypothetical protein